MKIKDCGEGDCNNGAYIKALEDALRPFAAYADKHRSIHHWFVITQGSGLSKKQLTMGDCYKASSVLKGKF